MKIEFSTTNYEFAHGKKPHGNGNWVFEVSLSDGHGSYSDMPVIWAPFLSYGAAKDHAREQIRNEAKMCGKAAMAVVTVLS